MVSIYISNLVFLEAEKTTTACNFQTIPINSFVMPRDLMRGKIGSYEGGGEGGSIKNQYIGGEFS